MPSTRTTAILGLWAIIAIVLIADVFVFSSTFLNSIFSGLGDLVNILIIAFIPFIFASWLLDKRVAQPATEETPQTMPRGARSASGNNMENSRPQPRVRRDKRVAKLETIVMTPQQSRGGSQGSAVSPFSANISEPGTTTSSSRFLRGRRSASSDEAKADLDVEEQLEAIEQEMAKLEGELQENGVSSSDVQEQSVNSEESTAPGQTTDNQTSRQVVKPTGEEASSELQAIDELLSRLEQKHNSGGIDEDTYLRLRSKYLKRRGEIASVT